jgi:4-amino-4-deoxy-L-arabinose transferase-like glycosyltransferase
MKRYVQSHKSLCISIILFCIAIIPRIFLLHLIPIGIEDDNINFILNAKAVFLTGHDLSGTWNPLSLTTLPGEQPQSEIIYLLLAPLIGLFPLSLFFANLPYVLASSLFAVLLYHLTKTLLDEKIAIAAGLLVAINPWSIFFARSAFESPIALLFFTTAWYLLIVLKGYNKLWSLLFLFFGFYTYMAYKLLLLPFVGIISLLQLSKTTSTHERKPIFLTIALSILLFGYFLVSLKFQPASSRLHELTLGNPIEIAHMVNDERKLAITNPFTSLFSNKPTLTLYVLSERYFAAFSPSVFFVQNEATPRFNLFRHGYFYLIDAVFLLLGIGYLFQRYRRAFYTLTLLFVLSPIPSVINNLDLSFAVRSSLMMLPLFLCIAAGIIAVLDIVAKRFHLVFYGGLSLIYAVFLSQFMYQYLFIQPVYSSPAVLFSGREVANYAMRNSSPTVVVTDQPKVYFKQYLFYTNTYSSSKVARQLQKNFQTNSYKLANVTFLTCKQVTSLDPASTYIFAIDEHCPIFNSTSAPVSIARLSDGGKIFSIYQDNLCNEYTLKRYPSNFKISDFSLESLSSKSFCEAFITKLD